MIRLILALVLGFFVWAAVWWTPAADTFIRVTHAHRTGDTVHLILKSDYKSYTWGDERTEERRVYLLDYSIDSGQLQLYGPLGDIDKYYKFGIDPEHRLIRQYGRYDSTIDEYLCTFDTLDLSHVPYQWSPEEKCVDGDETTGVNALLHRDQTTNFHSDWGYWKKDGSSISKPLPVQISADLMFQRPSSGGGFYKVLRKDGKLVAQTVSFTDEARDASFKTGAVFELNPEAPMAQFHHTESNKVLGLLPSGELLLAFEFYRYPHGKIMLIAWDLQNNSSRLLAPIDFYQLFSIDVDNYRKLGWWDKLEHFPFEKKHPVVPLRQVLESD